MKITIKTILLCLCLSCSVKANCQSNTILNEIDKICIHIDSLATSFERFYFELNIPKISVGYRLHYVDTLNKAYKKIILKNEVDTLTKVFYYDKERLIEIKVEKDVDPKLTAKYQFKENAITDSWDPHTIVKDTARLGPEGRRYFGLVRYKYK